MYRTKLFENIRSGKLLLPPYLSEEAKDLIVKLLERNPERRLGAGGAEEVKQHPWFKSIDWLIAISRGLKPPKPVLKKITPVNISVKAFYNGKRGKNKLEGWSFAVK